MILLLLLWPGTIWSEGLTKDLPTMPVQVAAQSDGSAVASVDLSDPNKFPFSSTGKWTGYLDFLGKPGTERSLGQPDLFLPLLQDKNDMTFFNLRGQLQFDNTDVHEYNIGLGHRHMFQEWILGGYGYYDQRHTQFGSAYSQFTGGLEALSVDWGARINGYLPENKTETIMSGANAQVIRPGDQIKVQIDGIVQEKALPGVDGEVGYLLPIPWKAYTAVFDETRVYAGGYHFFGEDQFESVTGPRGRVEWRAYDLPVLGPGSRFMMGVEAQWDEPRGSQAFGLASLRIPFDVFSDKSQRKALKGLDRRMLQPVIRDVDVVTSEVDVPTEIVAALNPAGKAYTKAIDVTLDELADAVADHPDEVIAIFVDGEGVESIDLNTDPRFVLPGNNQTLSMMGKELMVGYETDPYGAGTVGYTPAGTPFTLMSSEANFDQVVLMQPGSHLNGMTVDATGGREGITVPWGEPGRGQYYLTNSTIKNSGGAGFWARGVAEVYISDTSFENNGTWLVDPIDPARPNQAHRWAAGLDLTNQAKAIVTRSRFFGTGGRAIRAAGKSTLELSDSEVYDNLTNGIFVAQNGKAFITRTRIYNNGGILPDELRGHGLEMAGNGYVELTDSEVFGNYEDNIQILGTAEALISNTKIFGSQTGHGIGVSQSPTLTVLNSEIYGNALWGIKAFDTGTTQVETTLFSDNTLGAYCTDGLGTFDVDGDPVTGAC